MNYRFAIPCYWFLAILLFQSEAYSQSQLRPRLLVTAEEKEGLISLEALTASLNEGHGKLLWESVKSLADEAVNQPPFTAFTPLEGRTGEDIRKGNREFTITHAAGMRVKACALAHLITGEGKYKQAALTQVKVLFNDQAWPEWQDIYHRESFGLDADLRTGMLCRDLGLAFDWLYPSLSAGEKEWYIKGLDRKGIKPYLKAVGENAWWLERNNNWTTVVVGGLGILGMALEGEHKEAKTLVDLAIPRFQDYLDHYGPEGEFNENPAYAGSSGQPILFFTAYRYFRENPELPDELRFFQNHCHWLIYSTVPPGHIVPFGDGGPEILAGQTTSFFPAVAAATKDPVIQWYYHQFGGKDDRDPVLSLLYYDAEVEAKAPDITNFPLGRVFPAYDGIISSRSSWDFEAPASVVISKAGGGEVNHSHPDAGQVCVYGFGEELIRDLGKVNYPVWSERQHYYHFNSNGHNVLSFEGKDLIWNADHKAEITRQDFNHEGGGSWEINTTALYKGGNKVVRAVMHNVKGVVAVLDDATFDKKGKIRVRWHPQSPVEPDSEGNFLLEVNGVTLVGKMVELKGQSLDFTSSTHFYQTPYHKDRIGNELPQRREPYLDAELESQSAKILTLFAIYEGESNVAKWKEGHGQTWKIDLPAGDVVVKWDGNDMMVSQE